MNRTARCALLVLGLQLSWPLAFAQPLGSPPQDPIAGARPRARCPYRVCRRIQP